METLWLDDAQRGLLAGQRALRNPRAEIGSAAGKKLPCGRRA